MSDTPLARTWTVTIDGVLYVSKDGKFVEAKEDDL
jgi:hypothetical protein